MGTRIETFSGGSFDYADPKPESILLRDIAHALANTCRFGGHCHRYYSVAEHSVLVSRIVLDNPRLRLQALFHDGSEAYLGDIPSPLKNLLPAYQQLEQVVQMSIYMKFIGQPPSHGGYDYIHQADHAMLLKEMEELLVGGSMWDEYRTTEPAKVFLEHWTPAEAEHAFLKEHDILRRLLDE